MNEEKCYYGRLINYSSLDYVDRLLSNSSCGAVKYNTILKRFSEDFAEPVSLYY